MNSTYTQAIQHNDFVVVFDALLNSLFIKNRGEDFSSENLTSEKIKKAVWLASIAALGGEHEKNIASSFGALLYLYDESNEMYQRACYILQSRAGNIVSTKHLPDIIADGKYKSDFGSFMNFELVGKRISLEKKFKDETKIYFTDFQKNLWLSLVGKNNLAISAPTSSGKSFIIKKYIIELTSTYDEGEFIYIVPSKALINQVSNELSKALMGIATVITTYRDISENHKKVIYVLTPERCLKLLQEKTSKEPTVVFFDEVQNIEDNSRGSVYENVIYRMTQAWSSTQFVMAGPYIENLKTSLGKITDIKIVEQKTSATPVLQMKVVLTVSPRTKTVGYKIISPSGNIIDSEFNLGKGLYSKLTGQRGIALSHIISMFNSEDQNIIYSPKKNFAENWAIKISEGESIEEISANARIDDLTEFLSNEIHPSYSLIRTLKKGVAFHHGGLLDVARMEVEDLYSEGVINNIVCTSTLLQGVNLPADRIIILSPKVGNYELTQFEFLNLIGRAGRINSSLYGEIFCIDVKDEEWGKDKILNNEKKEIKSSVLRKIDENKESVISYIELPRASIIEQGGDEKIIPLVSYLRSQYLVDEKHFSKIVSNTILSANELALLTSRLKKCRSSLVIPMELLYKNQFIDPIEQNELYKMIQSDGVSKWLINKYPNSKEGVADEYAEFEVMTYYHQYRSIIQRLNDIFDIEGEVKGRGDGIFRKFYVSYKKLANDSHKWMQGKKYNFFIEDTLSVKFKQKNKKIDYKTIDSVTNFVTTHISTNLNFILVKYLSLWANIVSSFLSEEEREQYAYVLNLSSMLEMGSYKPIVLEIMSYGINRSTAIEIEKKYKGDIDVELFLKELDLNKLPPLHQKYLLRAGFGKVKKSNKITS
ncbi:DEAD/DEAH box helicase [Serratia fonticola]